MQGLVNDGDCGARFSCSLYRDLSKRLEPSRRTQYRHPVGQESMCARCKPTTEVMSTGYHLWTYLLPSSAETGIGAAVEANISADNE